MRRYTSFVLAIGVILLFLASCSSQSKIMTADDLVGKLMSSAEKAGYPIYDPVPSTSDESDSEFGEYIKDSYILYEGVYAFTYETKDTGELLHVTIWGDQSLMSNDGLNACGLYSGSLLSTLEGNKATEMASSLGMNDFNAFSPLSNTMDSNKGEYKFLVVPNKSIWLRYTVADKTNY